MAVPFINTVLNDLVTQMNAADFREDFSVTRTYIIEVEADLLPEDSEPVVRIAIQSLDSEPLTRTDFEDRYTISVAVLARVHEDDNDNIDRWVQTVVEIRDWLWTEYQPYTGTVIESITFGNGTGALYEAEELRNQKTFVGVVSPVFRVQ